MNIAVLQHNIFSTLKNLPINTRANPPILRYVLIRTSSDRSCEVAGTDLETIQIVRVGCKVDRPFAALVDFETLLDVVSLMRSNERIDITYDENQAILHVVQGYNRNRLKCWPQIEDFPSLPSADDLADSEFIATIDDVRGFKEATNHAARFCTAPKKHYAASATENLRLDIAPGEPIKIVAAGAYAMSKATIEADVQAVEPITLFLPPKALLKALEAVAADDAATSRTSRGRRIGGTPFDLSWIDTTKTLLLRNSTRIILIRAQESVSFDPPEYEVVAQAPLWEQKRLVGLFKVARRTRAGGLNIHVDEPGSVSFEAAEVTVACEAGEWETPDDESLYVSAEIELKGETVEAFEQAVAFRRDPKAIDYDMTLFLARRGEDWLIGVSGRGAEDAIITQSADVAWDYESEMMDELH